jgi:hypothetical protein
MIAPSTVRVTTAWLAGVTGVPAAGGDLPTDNTTWAASGFAQVTTVGGTPDVDVPLRRPVVRVSCWACRTPADDTPPWGQAEALAEAIADATWSAGVGRTVTLPTGYRSARVLSVVVVGEPRRIPSDPAGYARVDLDLSVDWVALA